MVTISVATDLKKALNYSYLLLKYRPRSKREIIFRLKRKKFPFPIINKAIDYLEEHGYINDEEFTRIFVSSRQGHDWGPKRIYFSLKKLGVSEELIEEALGDRNIYREKIKEIIKKKIEHYKGKKNIYQKILRYLGAKGFDYQEIIQELQNIETNIHEDR